MQLVGTVPRAREFLIDLAPLRGWRKVPTLSHLKRTRAKPHEREALREQLVELQSNPELAPLFAIERRTYEFARSLESERLSNKEYPSPRWGERTTRLTSAALDSRSGPHHIRCVGI